MRTIAANYIFPINDKPIKNGYIKLSDDGTIMSIGELSQESESTEFYNGILCPGFVNSHCHLELSHLKGKFERNTGMSGFIDQINRLRDSSSKEDRIEAIQREVSYLYGQGVSAVADISNGDESFQIKANTPLYTRSFLEVFGSEPKDAEEVMKNIEELHALAKSMNLDAAPTPHSPYTMSPELIKLASAAALKEGYLSYHNQESGEEEDLLISGTGALADNYKARGLNTPPITGKSALLYFLDVLKKCHAAPFEENILLVHNTVTNSESIDAAMEILKNLYWVTCPLSNIFIHNTLAPLHLLRKKGAKICLGTDSLSSNHILSIVEEIKCIQSHIKDIPLEEILQWACLNGAQALNKADTLGSFEVGKKPGVVLIDKIDWKEFKLSEDSKSTRII